MKFAKLHDLLKKPYLPALIVAVALIKLPPFYIVPGIEKSNSYNLVRLCILFSLIAIFFMKKKQNIFGRVYPILLILLLGYLFTQSVSIIYSTNITAFLNVYKDLVIGLILMFTILFFAKEDVVVLVKVFLISTVIGISYQFIFIFFPSVIEMVRPLLNTTYMQFVEYQNSRGRYFGDSLDEALIPIIFYYFSMAKKMGIKILLIGAFMSIVFLVVLSGWKTKFIILLYSIIGTLFIYKQIRKYLFFIIIMLVFAFAISYNLSIKLVGQNVFDRLLTGDPVEMHIEKNRITYLKDAFEIGLSHPITGVGLGNYYDNLLEVNKKVNQSPVSIFSDKRFILTDDPHNVFFSLFATTGLLGLISMTTLLIFFFVTDLSLLKKSTIEKFLVLAFWGYFIFSFFNPWMYFSFLIPFWFLRGVIENFKLNK